MFAVATTFVIDGCHEWLARYKIAIIILMCLSQARLTVNSKELVSQIKHVCIYTCMLTIKQYDKSLSRRLTLREIVTQGMFSYIYVRWPAGQT